MATDSTTNTEAPPGIAKELAQYRVEWGEIVNQQVVVSRELSARLDALLLRARDAGMRNGQIAEALGWMSAQAVTAAMRNAEDSARMAESLAVDEATARAAEEA